MREYFGIIYRKIQKNPLETVNKIAGLTLAVVACLLIAFYVNDELSYDRFHSKKDRVYRLVHGNSLSWSSLLFPELREKVPGIVKISEIDVVNNNNFQNSFEVNQTLFQGNGIFHADKEILDILDFNILESQSQDLLVAPYTMLISRTMAEKFFGRERAVGQVIRYNATDLTVTGVFEDFPAQSHINPQFLISLSTPSLFRRADWNSMNSYAYVLLSPNASPEEVVERIREAVHNAAGQHAEKLFGDKKFALQPITDIHLHSSDFTLDYAKKGDFDFVRMIMMIGILILLVASANHINLTITQTMGETKQFAVMKTMGGLPHQIRQYIYAGILFDVAISVAMAALITLMILPLFGNVVGKQFALGLETWLYMACLLVAIVVIVTFITAVYPAFLFSRIPVMRIFQKSEKIGGENLRKGLTVFQFTVAVMLIASTIFMYRQMQLLTAGKLGFNKEQLLIVKNPPDISAGQEMMSMVTTQYERFKTVAEKFPVIESISGIDNVPAGIINNFGSISEFGSEDKIPCSMVMCDMGFFQTLQAIFITGRDFTESEIDRQAVISRKLVEALGETPEGILGKEYEFWGKKQITGVVEDIQYNPYRKNEERAGTIYFKGPFNAPVNILVRTAQGSDFRTAVAQLEQAWKEAAPNYPFVYEMMDERLQRSYQKELADIRTITAFSVVAIFLSCFGVMGISRYTARKRTKEIAIRKVNGASKKDIMLLLNSNFMALNLIAFVIAIPVVILFINNWLQNFSYKTNLDWWVFVLAGLATAVVVVATVSWQSWRAANANPVEVLKSE